MKGAINAGLARELFLSLKSVGKRSKRKKEGWKDEIGDKGECDREKRKKVLIIFE